VWLFTANQKNDKKSDSGSNAERWENETRNSTSFGAMMKTRLAKEEGAEEWTKAGNRREE
jgi:hypothetical protein